MYHKSNNNNSCLSFYAPGNEVPVGKKKIMSFVYFLSFLFTQLESNRLFSESFDILSLSYVDVLAYVQKCKPCR